MEKQIWVIPNTAPYLRENFINVNWNCTDKSLEIEIEENEAFQAYKWLSNLSIEDNLVVCIYKTDSEILQMIFTGLKLKDHFFPLMNEFVEKFSHNVEIEYEKMEIKPLSHSNLKDVKSNMTSGFDEEWQKTDLLMATND